MTLEELTENFSYLADWEDKYRYLIELGETLEDFPKEALTEANKVEGCQSQVWIVHYVQDDHHYFKATSDAHIVRGLEAVLLTFVNGLTSEEIQKLDIQSLFKKMGLEEHLSPSRRNGFVAMTNRILSLTL